jgi:very-short-patch-repair endonuclease
MNPKIKFYNNRLKGYAKNMRNDSTKAEVRLWNELMRAKTMKGYSFRRQRPVLQYIADFMCKELNLIIEVDGISHYDEEQFRLDKKRTADLVAGGFTVLRFDHEEVIYQIDNVQREIEGWIEEWEERNKNQQI